MIRELYQYAQDRTGRSDSSGNWVLLEVGELVGKC